MKVAVSYIAPDIVTPEVWEDIGVLIDRAIIQTGGRFVLDDVYELVLSGAHQLWVAVDEDSEKIVGAVTSQVTVYPQTKKLILHMVGGDQLRLWKRQMLDLLHRWAVDNGCSGVEFWGREGWAKVLAEDGYVRSYVMYEYDLPVEPPHEKKTNVVEVNFAKAMSGDSHG